MNSTSSSTKTNSVLSCKSNEITWNHRASYDLHLLKTDKSTNSNSVPEIKRLVKDLVQLTKEVKRVRAVATSFPDIHWIDFQIQLEDTNTDLADETWDRIQDLIIDYEWKLIDDSAEEWYFRPQIVDEFYPLKDRVIADSSGEQQMKISKLKTWSSHYPNFILF